MIGYRVSLVALALMTATCLPSRASTLPQNGIVHFYTITGEVDLFIASANLPGLPDAFICFCFAQEEVLAQFSLSNQLGQTMTPDDIGPHDLYGVPYDTAKIWAINCPPGFCSGFDGGFEVTEVEYTNLPAGPYTLSISSYCGPDPCSYSLSGDITLTPLPATLPFFAAGAALIGAGVRRRQRRASSGPSEERWLEVVVCRTAGQVLLQ